ncbi:hypothetical protein GQ44DRAFT_706133 [Phaeosphaeriaceae sp. PMI808]|nr:hypothetical protein GQ44DRAFT_706133 [Phaeosphaeriaceae sp. PMI808]
MLPLHVAMDRSLLQATPPPSCKPTYANITTPPSPPFPIIPMLPRFTNFSRPLRQVAPSTFRTLSSTASTMGVQKTVISEGNGPSPSKGDVVTMEYTGWLRTPGEPEEKGKQFDSTTGRGPFKTDIGIGRVIKGWDEGVVTMKLGEKARLDITSDFAYGNQSFPGLIPPNSDLIFEVELKKIN